MYFDAKRTFDKAHNLQSYCLNSYNYINFLTPLTPFTISTGAKIDKKVHQSKEKTQKSNIVHIKTSFPLFPLYRKQRTFAPRYFLMN